MKQAALWLDLQNIDTSFGSTIFSSLFVLLMSTCTNGQPRIMKYAEKGRNEFIPGRPPVGLSDPSSQYSELDLQNALQHHMKVSTTDFSASKPIKIPRKPSNINDEETYQTFGFAKGRADGNEISYFGNRNVENDSQQLAHQLEDFNQDYTKASQKFTSIYKIWRE
ncbi:hypothetical protein DFH28DRAFT_926798 [Melampsora americana]|nr:hypothetical protein DFH28DRAFT_926798 [Melampsora americana]